jgi:hypothetical protein
MAAANVCRVPITLQSFFTANGDLNANGTIWTYYAGTTIGCNTYQDDSGLVLNPNPITITIGGVLPDAIYSLQGQEIDLYYFDSGNNQIKVDTNVQGINDPIFTGVVSYTTGGYISLAANGQISYKIQQTTAEISAGVTPTNFQYAPGDVRRYGAVLDGATDCTAALQQACNVGGALVINGPMVCASASLGALQSAALPNGINIYSNTTITFTEVGSITITGNTPCNLFYSYNVENVGLIDPVIYGNSNGDANNHGYLWYLKADGTASQDMPNFTITGGVISNFGGNYWIYFDNTTGTTYRMRNITISDNYFVSMNGNSYNTSNIEFTSTVVGFIGSTTVNIYGVEDIYMTDNLFDGQYMRNFVTFWSGVQRAHVSETTIIGCGTDPSFSNDVGCYAINIYDFSHGNTAQPDQIHINNVLIDGVRSCGVYIAGGDRVYINDIQVNRQTDTTQTELSKGAIVNGGCNLFKLCGAQLYQCNIGVTTGGQTPGTEDPDIYSCIEDVSIYETPPNGIGLQINAAGNTNTVDVDGLSIYSTQSGVEGVVISGTANVGADNLTIRNFDINVPGIGMYLLSVDGSAPNFVNVHIDGGEISNTGNYGINWSGMNAATSRLVVENVVFKGLPQNSVGLSLANTSNVTIRSLTFTDMATGGSGACISSNSTTGTMEGVRYRNVATGNKIFAGSAVFGANTPAWTGNDNDFVQNLLPVQAGTTSSKYILTGWQWDYSAAAWMPCRSLTGN